MHATERSILGTLAVLAHTKIANCLPSGVSIAVMGCIVNGPGEMADADFGYVGGAPGKIDLYVGKEVVRRAIPMAGATDELIELIKVCLPTFHCLASVSTESVPMRRRNQICQQ